ncbi:hypothetical protein F5Y01DRAFT_306286 [Xylaria sp. FL0043]|nr:hypothetical protein F5Y01DRAFT_306286 [Xylaria sp. FL0043]
MSACLTSEVWPLSKLQVIKQCIEVLSVIPAAPPTKSWLKSALPNRPFTYAEDKVRTPNSNALYLSLVESIDVKKWHELEQLPDLEHLGGEPDRPLGAPCLAATKPAYLDVSRLLMVEDNLEDFLNPSLIYCVNVALRSTNNDRITVLSHLPLTSDEGTVQGTDNTVRKQRTYTPDYTVIKGDFQHNHGLLWDDSASLVVGDAKLCGPKAVNNIAHTRALSKSTLGQLLWYCVCRKTRFSFCVSDLELILIEFSVPDDKDAEELSNVVAKAELELSSPIKTQEAPSKDEPGEFKRGYSPNTPNLSPGDQHRHKHFAGNDDGSVASSPLRFVSRNGIPEHLKPQSSESGPRTPENKPALASSDGHEPSSSNSYVPSTPGEVSLRTLQELKDAGGRVKVRLFSFPVEKIEQWAPALFGFISLSHLVDSKGDKHKRISSASTNVHDYSVNPN